MIVNAWSMKKSLVVCAALLLTTSAYAQMGMGHRDGNGNSSGRVETDRSDRQRLDDNSQVQRENFKQETNANDVSDRKENAVTQGRLKRGTAVQRHQAAGGVNSGLRNNSVAGQQRGAVRARSNSVGAGQGSAHVRPVGRAGNNAVRGNISGHPSVIRNHNEILRTPRSQSVIRFPNEGPNHQKFQGRALSSAPRMQHMAPMRNAVVLNHVRNYDRLENVHNRYYWHNDGGYRFCHYYDDWGFHWYGWYAGDDFFWTRYYYGRWWWYDPSFDRWCYWHDNGWWWQDPSRGLVYVYANNNYTPAEESSDTTQSPEGVPSNSASHTEFWDAADNRVVKVFGQDAFLYDTSNSPAFDPTFLSSNVSDVKFSKSKNGRSAQIMLTLEDGSFLLFDGNGNPYK